jgi:peptidoglycan endopeptidase LytE
MFVRRILIAVLALTVALTSLPLFSTPASAKTLGDIVADRAKDYVGIKNKSFDSADFVSYVFKKEDIEISSRLYTLSRKGEFVSKSNLAPGDLLYFGRDLDRLSAVGIYVGNNEFIVSFQPYGEVKKMNLNDETVQTYYLGAKRILSQECVICLTPDQEAGIIDDKNSEKNNRSVADQIIKTGEKFLGVPYKFGAPSGRTDIFDCSSFTQYVYWKNGIKLPRTSRQQAKVGKYIPKDQLRKGDLVFYSTSYSVGEIAHVAIYAGDGKLLHTFREPEGVTYTNFNSKWWQKHYIGARRVID